MSTDRGPSDRTPATGVQMIGYHPAGRALRGRDEGPFHLTLVDDDPRVLRVLLMLLGNAGFAVRGFTSPEVALDHVLDRGADAVMTDLGMPGIDGVELCRRVRDAQGPGAPPFVLHTGSVHALSPADRALFAAVIEKPCRPEEILGTLMALSRARV